MLRLRGEYLSNDEPMQDYWYRRSRIASGIRVYRPLRAPEVNSGFSQAQPILRTAQARRS